VETDEIDKFLREGIKMKEKKDKKRGSVKENEFGKLEKTRQTEIWIDQNEYMEQLDVDMKKWGHKNWKRCENLRNETRMKTCM
jgi:hypothetical protein